MALLIAFAQCNNVTQGCWKNDSNLCSIFTGLIKEKSDQNLISNIAISKPKSLCTSQ